MGYSRIEQETHIVWDEELKTAHLYTASPVTMRKLDKLTVQFPDVYRRTWIEKTGDSITAAKYEIDARFVRFSKPASVAQTEARRMNAFKINSAPQ